MVVRWDYGRSDKSYFLKVVVQEICTAYKQGRRYSHEQCANMLRKGYRDDRLRARAAVELARKVRKANLRMRPSRRGGNYKDLIKPKCEGCVWAITRQQPCRAVGVILMDIEGNCMNKRGA